jgi:hypothetical protein
MITNAELELRLGNTMFRGRREMLYRGFIVLCLERGIAFLQIIREDFRFSAFISGFFIPAASGEDCAGQNDRGDRKENVSDVFCVRHHFIPFTVLLMECLTSLNLTPGKIIEKIHSHPIFFLRT